MEVAVLVIVVMSVAASVIVNIRISRGIVFDGGGCGGGGKKRFSYLRGDI